MENNTTQKRILIVEDDESLLRGLSDKFSREGFVVSLASNGIEGFSSAMMNHPDVILLDIVMSEMDGLTMLEKLRAANDWGKTASVVFLTNLSPDSNEIMAKITKNEPAFYLVKSEFLLSDVVAKVRECIAAKGDDGGKVDATQ